MKLIFRSHTLHRMFERGISADEVSRVVDDGSVIENYVADFPYAGALRLGFAGGRPLHVVTSDNRQAGERIIITVYRPNRERWESDWSTRRM